MKALVTNRKAKPAAWLLAILLVPALLIEFAGTATPTSAAARRARSPARAAAGTAAARSKNKVAKTGTYNPADESVELFAAQEAKQLDVKLIPRDSTQGRVFIKNKTKKALNVKLPAAFAATPVLAQMGGGQGMGGGMGMMGGGGMGMMSVPPEKKGEKPRTARALPAVGSHGVMNVPAGKEVQFQVIGVCLEHGKPEPRPTMVYELKPVEKFTKKPGVRALLEMLGNGRISQRAAQVAAWHLNNDMSFEELAAKTIQEPDGTTLPYFTPEELTAGMAAVSQAKALTPTEDSEESVPSPGETARP